MSLIPSISSLRESMVNVTRRFPVACIFAVLLAFALIIMIWCEEYRGVAVYYLTAGFLLSLMLSLWAEEYHRPRVVWTVAIAAHALLLIDTVILWNSVSTRFNYALYIARSAVYVALILGILFLSFYKEKNDVKAWNFTRRMLIAVVRSFLIGGVMTAGIEGLLAGIQGLFNIEIDSKLYASLAILSGLLLPLLLLLSRVPEGDGKHDTSVITSRVLTGTTRYLFIPLVACYMLVLYLYLAKILFTWELPKSSISTLVTVMMFGIIAIEFLLYPAMRSEGSKTFERWVVRWFPILALPLVILMTVGIVRRFSDYGITVNRLYILTLNLWFYAVCIGLFVNKARRIHWISLSFGAILLLTSAQPMNICEIVKRHYKQQINDVMAQYKPEKLPMSSDVYKQWMQSLPEDVALRTRDQLRYLDNNYKDQTSVWLEDDVPMWWFPSSKEEEEKEFFSYRSSNNYVLLPQGYKCLFSKDRNYYEPSDKSINDSIFTLTAEGMVEEKLTFEINLNEFERKKGQGIDSNPLYFREKQRGDSVILTFDRLIIDGDSQKVTISYRARIFYK